VADVPGGEKSGAGEVNGALPAARARCAPAHRRPACGWACAGAGALIAACSVIDGYAVKLLPMGPVLFDYVCDALRVPMLFAAPIGGTCWVRPAATGTCPGGMHGDGRGGAGGGLRFWVP
jgi:hypothetical protein